MLITMTPLSSRLRSSGRVLSIRAAGALLLGLLVLGLIAPTPLVAEGNRIILRVNDKIASLYDYRKAVAQRQRAINLEGGMDADVRANLLKEVEVTVLDEMFRSLLVSSRADQLGITVSDFEVDQAIAEMKRANNVQDDSEFEAALAREGITLKDLQDKYRSEQLRYGVVNRDVRGRINIEDEALRSFYKENPDRFKVPEQVQVEEIVVLTGDGASELSGRIAGLVKAGKTLAEIKEQYGEKVSGVLEVGWVKPGDLDAVLETAIWDLEPGEVAGPVEARGGFHVARVLDKKEESALPFEDVKEQIYRRMFGRQMGDEFESYLDELARTAYLVCKPPAGDFCTERKASLGSGELDVDRLFSKPSVTQLKAEGAANEAESGN